MFPFFLCSYFSHFALCFPLFTYVCPHVFTCFSHIFLCYIPCVLTFLCFPMYFYVFRTCSYTFTIASSVFLVCSSFPQCVSSSPFSCVFMFSLGLPCFLTSPYRMFSNVFKCFPYLPLCFPHVLFVFIMSSNFF